jgi:hypothetical protein
LDSQREEEDKQTFTQPPNELGDGNNSQIRVNAQGHFCVNPIHESSLSTVFVKALHCLPEFLNPPRIYRVVYGACQRFTLAAVGGKLAIETGKTQSQKNAKNAPSPSRPVHAVLGGNYSTIKGIILAIR